MLVIPLPFADRKEAGRLLATELLPFNLPANLVVLGLPRGGLPVGLQIAKRFAAPLDVVLVRKLGVPGRPELAMGAIAESSFQTLNRELITELGISPNQVEDHRRGEGGNRPPPDSPGRAALR